MSHRAWSMRALAAGFGLLMLGCGAPAATTQAPVTTGTAATAGYHVQQHVDCRARYQRCIANYSTYWVFRDVRCRRDYRQCVIDQGATGGEGGTSHHGDDDDDEDDDD